MKKILVVTVLVLASFSFAGNLRIYGDYDAADKFKVSLSGVSVESSQDPGLLVGIEYIRPLDDSLSLVVGGRHQTSRKVGSNTYTATTGYGQLLLELKNKYGIGAEISYCMLGLSNLASGDKVDPGIGYGLFGYYDLSDLMSIKVGYRVANAKYTSSGIALDVSSSGLFFQFGILL